jgi:hypothetical protein
VIDSFGPSTIQPVVAATEAAGRTSLTQTTPPRVMDDGRY